MPGLDIIGDVHGHAAALEALLRRLGYRHRHGAWRHPDRRAIFLGDFIDRGPEQLRTLELVHAMCAAGSAEAVMGNHEFNAIALATADPEAPGEHLRARTVKNLHQTERFLAEVGLDSRRHRAWIDWFRRLPLWLERDGLRVVHACWHAPSMEALAEVLNGHCCLTDAGLVAGTRRGTEAHRAFDTLLKGLETELPEGQTLRDKDGHERAEVRARWWHRPPLSYRDAAILPAETAGRLPETLVPAEALPGYADEQPVFIGHYWLQGRPVPLAERVACVDYSVAAGGKLCAYRWDGEPALSGERFVWVAP